MSQSGYEKKDANVAKLGLIALVSILFVIGSIVMLNEVFLAEKEKLVQERVLQVESEELKALHERETETLTSYKKNDSVAGRYQIPIERAMELIAAESNDSSVGKK